MTQDVLDRLRAANIAPEDEAPPFAHTRRRIAAPRRRRAPGVRTRRVGMLGMAAAAAAIAVTVLAASGPSQRSSAPLGVLQAAAATAQANPEAARFSGFVAETTANLGATSETKASVERTWKVVRPLSDTEFEGRLELLHPKPTPEQERMMRKLAKMNKGKVIHTDGVHTSRPEGDQIREIYTWNRPYGTLFSGALGPGEKPSPVPTDPAVAAQVVAAYGTGTAPADLDPAAAHLVDDAVGKGGSTAKALTYAEMVLTAPRVNPDVRAAVYQAIAKLPGVRIEPHATDPLGRPAAAVISEIRYPPSTTRSEMLIDPDSARVLAHRYVSKLDPGANDHRAKGEPPYSESSEVTTYRYDEG